jgi:serine/threonine protein kinase
VKTNGKRACQVCGTALYDNSDPCPVCALRGALGNEQSISESPTEPALLPSQLRFEHYEVLTRDDGTPLELGRGAMGVTYKALDVNLRYAVALKIINARFIGDESARRRFVREARAAASVRHPNVASVFHLGKSGDSYFYAMEYVEGETLERVIRRSGRLEVKLALEITTQVALGLAAVQKKNLVHRDIKPSNIMVCTEEGRAVTVKIIDLGLAKIAAESQSETAISVPGSFAGTPEFASPEQFAGIGVDIRSDLYSLGVTLWTMLVGKVPFEGAPGEVMYQHQHVALPLRQLQGVPRPVSDLIKFLLAKDPGMRPQTPAELQTLLHEVRATLDSDLPPSVLSVRRVAENRPASFGHAKKRILTLAVLPFDNVGDDKQNEYFCDGLTGEVIFQLSKISELCVISRSSVLRYKAYSNAERKTLRQIGAELHASVILEGSIQHLGNRLKIVTILYNVRTNRRLWGESYDREIKDLFAIQNDVAENIAAALHIRLSVDQRAYLQHRQAENLTAYDLYLRGVALFELLHEKDNERAISLFRRAIETDPKFALGYAGMARAYIERWLRFGGEKFWVSFGIELCLQAIKLDPKQVRGYTVLALAFNVIDLHDQAQEPVRRALGLIPNDVQANEEAVYLLRGTDRFVERYERLRKCHSLNPNSPDYPYQLAVLCTVVDETQLQAKWMQRALYLEGDPERHRMMECEHKILCRDYGAALIGLRQLPLNLKAHSVSVADKLLSCSMRLGDWSTALRIADSWCAEHPADRGKWWFVLQVALALRGLRREAEATQKAESVVAFARGLLPINQTDPYPRLLLAIANRLLGREEEAYRNLRLIFPALLVDDLDLMRDDPRLDLFAADADFQIMVADFEKQSEVTRAEIREIEENF